MVRLGVPRVGYTECPVFELHLPPEVISRVQRAASGRKRTPAATQENKLGHTQREKDSSVDVNGSMYKRKKLSFL